MYRLTYSLIPSVSFKDTRIVYCVITNGINKPGFRVKGDSLLKTSLLCLVCFMLHLCVVIIDEGFTLK